MLEWLEAHPLIQGALILIAAWLLLSLLSLVQRPKPGSWLDTVVKGARTVGVDMPALAGWLSDLVRRIVSLRVPTVPELPPVSPPSEHVLIVEKTTPVDAVTPPPPDVTTTPITIEPEVKPPPKLCNGCGKPLLPENAWMTDRCPCNSPLGINDEPPEPPRAA